MQLGTVRAMISVSVEYYNQISTYGINGCRISGEIALKNQRFYFIFKYRFFNAVLSLISEVVGFTLRKVPVGLDPNIHFIFKVLRCLKYNLSGSMRHEGYQLGYRCDGINIKYVFS